MMACFIGSNSYISSSCDNKLTDRLTAAISGLQAIQRDFPYLHPVKKIGLAIAIAELQKIERELLATPAECRRLRELLACDKELDESREKVLEAMEDND
ncbi:MAG TPA: hypothetical protein VLG50_06880 [Candidatus Saccharimonadales bacterium]|nr:hypothetical protein [Candidatus Saccharimonadales bacterium]